jgi:transglutaminase-like putative cysteine protease
VAVVDPYVTHAPGRSAVVCAAVAVVGAAWGLVVTGGLPVGGLATTALGVGAAAVVRRVSSSRAARAWTGVLAALAGAVWLPGVVSASGILALWPVLALCLAVRQFASARSLREVRLVLGLSVLVVLAAAGVSPVSALVGPVVVVWSAVLVGFAGAVPHRVGGGGQRARTVRAVSAAGVVGVSLFLLVPVTTGSPLSGGVPGRASGGNVGASAAAPRTGAAYAGGDLDLSSRGELPQTELVSVPAGSPSWWRSGVLDTYDGRTWSGSATSSWSSSWSSQGWSAGPEDGAWGVRRVDVVERLSDDYPALLSAGSPVAVASAPSGSGSGSDVRLVAVGGATVLGPGASAYEVTSSVTPTLDSPVGGGGQGPGPVDVRRWVQVPSSVPQRVRDLGVRLVSTAGGDPVEAARAVNEHLHAVARYSLDAPVPAAGEDAVDAFLFVDRIGFCEHFASAEVVLLRAAGIPARLVTGFAGGTEEGGRRVLRGVDAHAWVEVWVPGQGWTTSDPTAGAVLVDGEGGSWGQRLWSWVLRAAGDLLASAVSRTVLAVGLVVVAGGLWLLVRALRLRGRGPAVVPVAVARRRGEASVTALLVALERFDAALPPGRRRGAAEGLSAWRSRLPAEVGGELEAALVVVERACFARRLPARADLESARGTLERAAAEVLAADLGERRLARRLT